MQAQEKEPRSSENPSIDHLVQRSMQERKMRTVRATTAVQECERKDEDRHQLVLIEEG